MEIEIGDYGQIIFEMMVGDTGELPDHWARARHRAEPLVRQLIRLNGELRLGYELIGYKDDNGKLILSKAQKIDKAQKTWAVPAKELKIGDQVWLLDSRYDNMRIENRQPGTVTHKIKNIITIEILISYGRWEAAKIQEKDYVLKAPPDWEKNQDRYSSDEYWLEIYEQLPNE